MKTLAIDLSSSRRSVAAADGATVLAAVSLETIETSPLTMIEQVLAAAEWRREYVEAIALGIGPGSYAGIRSAIAIAQGWQLAREVRLIPISSIDCLAARLQLNHFNGSARLLIDAQRGEFYRAGYEISESLWRQTTPLEIITRATLEAEIEVPTFGPDLEKHNARCSPLFPDAAALAMIAAGRDDSVSGELIEPIYHRLSQFAKSNMPRTILTQDLPNQPASDCNLT